jgi:hypothetical protein
MITTKLLLTTAAITSTAGILAASMASPAEATPSRQQILAAAARLTQEGCDVRLFPTTNNPTLGLSCSNESVSNLLNPYLSESGFRIYSTGWSGDTKLDWRIGPQEIRSINFRQPGSKTTRLGPGKLGQWGGRFSPYDARIRISPAISSGRESIAPIRGGFKLTIPLSRATVRCEGDPIGPGGWIDRACPDLSWNNGKIYANLILNRDLSLSRRSNSSISGSWDLGGIDRFVSDSWANNIVSNLASTGLDAIIPAVNNKINKFAKASIISKYAGLPQNCINLDYTNDRLNISIPVDASRHSRCANALGIPAVTASRGSSPGGTQGGDTACANRKTTMGIWSFRDRSRNKYVRGGVTAEGRNDLVGALAPRVTNPKKAWETFKLYSIPGVEGGRRIQNTIDGRWLETVDATNTLLLHGPVRRCRTSNRDMQWRVIAVPGQRGIYKLQSLRNNKFVQVTSNGLLKANTTRSQATPFGWRKY